jgi:hypothetical protein
LAYFLSSRLIRALDTGTNDDEGIATAKTHTTDPEEARVSENLPAGGNDGGAVTSEGLKLPEMRKRMMRPDKGEEERRQEACGRTRGRKRCGRR